MRKIIVAAIFVASAAGGGYAHEMPEEVRRFLDNYTIDSTADWGPLHFRRRYIPDSVQIKDLRLRVLRSHAFKQGISFNDYPDTVALSELIEPTLWRVLVMAHGEPIYEFSLSNRTGEPRVQTSNVVTRQHPIWIPLLKAYPEPTSINPVLVAYSESTINFFLYFEQLGPRKIYYTEWPRFNPTLDSLFTASIETLDDSKILIRYLKEREVNERANRIERNAPHENIQNIERNENNERQIERPAVFIEGNLMRDFPPAKNNQ